MDVINDMWVITILLSLVATLFGVLIVILGWMGSRVYSRLQELVRAMHNIEVDIYGKISNLDRRITVVETTIQHRSEII